MFGAELVGLEQSTCSEYSFFVDWSSCVFGTEPVLGTRVWRGARFSSRVARIREVFEFGSRNARDFMRRTQRIIKPPS